MDFACEEALYNSISLGRFAGIDLGCEAVPGATMLLKFRHLLERHQLGERLFAEAGRVLQDKGMKVKTGTLADATIIHAPSSTKNKEKQRDPKMHQTRKRQQWYFGMTLHIEVDRKSGLAHSAMVTPANVHDKHALPHLLHGRKKRVYGDNTYASQKTLIASRAPQAKDFTNERVKKRKDGEVLGRRLSSWRPATPCSGYRFHHFLKVGRDMPHFRHTPPCITHFFVKLHPASSLANFHIHRSILIETISMNHTAGVCAT